MKKCRVCNKIKALELFPKDKRNKDGHWGMCHACHNQYCAALRLKNLEKWRARHRDWSRRYSLLNKEKVAGYKRAYVERNIEKIRAHNRLRMSKKTKEDPSFRILGRLRSSLWQKLKRNKKSDSAVKLLGCSLEYFKEYLEARFTEGMSWENAHKWHVDHIRPCNSFDLSDPEQQRQCFHYTNLQPLWAIDNWRKGAKWNPKDVHSAI